MPDHQNELERLRFWNRAAMISFLAGFPIAGLVARLTFGTFLYPVLFISAFAACVAAWLFGYYKIRTFRCPQCGKLFTVEHAGRHGHLDGGAAAAFDSRARLAPGGSAQACREHGASLIFPVQFKIAHQRVPAKEAAVRSIRIILLACGTLAMSSTTGHSRGTSAYEQHLSNGEKSRDAGNCAEAKKQFAMAAAEAEAFGTGDIRLVTALGELGFTHDRSDELEEAEAAYKRAFKPLANLKTADPTAVGKFWRNYGRLLVRTGRFTQAAEVYETAVESLKRGRDRVALGQATSQLGSCYDFLGRPDDSEMQYKRAVEILKKAGNQKGLAATCTNLALHYSSRRKIDRAWGAYSCALSAAEKSGGLATRQHQGLLESYSADLKKAGLADKAAETDAMLARIALLPHDKPGECRTGQTTTSR